MIPISRLDSANLGAFWAKIFPSRSRLRRSRNSSSAELCGCPMAAQWVMVMVDGHLRIWDFFNGVLESQQLTNVRNKWCGLSRCLCGSSFFIFDQSIWLVATGSQWYSGMSLRLEELLYNICCWLSDMSAFAEYLFCSSTCSHANHTCPEGFSP